MNVYAEQLRQAIDGVTIHSPTRFSWLSNPSPLLSRRTTQVMTPELKRTYLQYTLQQALYVNFYMHGRALPVRKRNGSVAIGTTPFVARLSAANSSTGERRELLSFSPGFYVAVSDAEATDQSRTVRLYWHLQSAGAVLAMREITTRLNEAGLAFQFKVVNDPAHYDRCDAGVLYFAKEDRDRVFALVARIHSKLRPFLDERAPAFAKPLARGVGLAEDPGEGASFGLHRCFLIAGALIDGPKRGAAVRLAHCTRFLREHGVDLEAPYLNPGSTDDYRLDVPAVPVTRRKRTTKELTRERCLDFASNIGRDIASSAMWFEGRCNWVSVIPEATTPGLRSLEPDLYAGTAGIAWFLAELFLRTGEPRLRATALGAIEQALLRIETHLPIHHWGL